MLAVEGPTRSSPARKAVIGSTVETRMIPAMSSQACVERPVSRPPCSAPTVQQVAAGRKGDRAAQARDSPEDQRGAGEAKREESGDPEVLLVGVLREDRHAAEAEGRGEAQGHAPAVDSRVCMCVWATSWGGHRPRGYRRRTSWTVHRRPQRLPWQ